jgi:hypothetical protein
MGSETVGFGTRLVKDSKMLVYVMWHISLDIDLGFLELLVLGFVSCNAVVLHCSLRSKSIGMKMQYVHLGLVVYCLWSGS